MTTARLGIDIVAFNRTNQAFAQAQRGLRGVEQSIKRMKASFAGIGLAVSVERFSRALIEAAMKTDPVREKFRQLDDSWNNFALRVADAGLSQGMIKFANSVQKVTSGANDLDEVVGKFMGGAATALGVFLEQASAMAQATAREIKWLGDTFKYVSEQILNLPQLPSWLANPNATAAAAGRAVNEYFMHDFDRLFFSNAEPGKGHLPVGVNIGGEGSRTRAIPSTPGEPGKGSLPANIDRNFNLIKPEKIKKITDEIGEMADAWRSLTESPLEEFTRKQAELDMLLGKGAISASTYARGIKSITEEFAPAAQQIDKLGVTIIDTMAAIGESISTSVLDGFDAIITKAKSVSEAFRDMGLDLLRSLTSIWTNNAFQMLFGGGGGGGQTGGILGSLIGRALGAPTFAGLYASGGSIPSGKWGIVGEAGPEVVSGPATVTPMMRGGAVNIQIVDQRNNAPPVERERGANGSERFIIRDAVRDVLGSGSADKQLSQRTGGRPVPVRRG